MSVAGSNSIPDGVVSVPVAALGSTALDLLALFLVQPAPSLIGPLEVSDSLLLLLARLVHQTRGRGGHNQRMQLQ